MKKGLIIAAVVLIVSGALLIAYSFAASDFDFSQIGAGEYKTVKYDVTDRFEKIDINTREADIVIRPSENGECSVTCGEREKVRHSVAVREGTLFIKVQDSREWYEHFTLFSKRPHIEVALPEVHYETLGVKGSTGDVSVIDFITFTDIDINVSTGDVACAALADRNFKIKTSTGSVKLNDASAGNMSIEVSTGDISMVCTFVSDTLSVKSSTGDVHFENCDADTITVKTSTGDVTGTLESGKVFSTKTSTGSVNVPDTASGGRCEIKTSTGDIDIRLTGK